MITGEQRIRIDANVPGKIQIRVKHECGWLSRANHWRIVEGRFQTTFPVVGDNLGGQGACHALTRASAQRPSPHPPSHASGREAIPRTYNRTEDGPQEEQNDVLDCHVISVAHKTACQAAAGSSRIACSSAPVMAQPQVNSTVRRGVASDSRCAISSWLSPAPPSRTSSRQRMQEAILRLVAVSTAA